MDSNERKKKIKMLEAEIELMQKDHAETFGYTLPKKIKLTAVDAVIFIAGIVFLLSGIVWTALNINFINGLAVFTTGGVRFFRSVYSLPLILGITLLILCKKKAVPAAITAAGLAVSLTETFFRDEYPLHTSAAVIMTAVTIMGAVMTGYAAVKYFLKKSRDNDR